MSERPPSACCSRATSLRAPDILFEVGLDLIGSPALQPDINTKLDYLNESRGPHSEGWILSDQAIVPTASRLCRSVFPTPFHSFLRSRKFQASRVRETQSGET